MLEHIDALIAFIAIIFLGSLLVTVFTQIVVTVLNLRGQNLLWGLTVLLCEMEPKFKKNEAKEVASEILKNKLIARGKKYLPSVIRVEEFSELLIKLGEFYKGKKPSEHVKSSDDKKLSQNALECLERLTSYDPEELKKLLEKLPVNLTTVAKKNLKKAQQLVFEHLKQARTKITELESWFDSMTDRISERFTLRSKIIAVVGAFLVSFGFQLDAIHIMKQAYSDEELRSKLVASTDLIMERGKDILEKRSIFDISVAEFRSEIKDLPDPPRSFSNRLSAEEWLKDHLPDKEKSDDVIKKFREIHKIEAKKRLDYLGEQVLELNNQLSKMGLQIFGESYSWSLKDWEETKLVGILISVVLLSLGAPFWFNLLKNLVNLRTHLMQREEKERAQRRSGEDKNEA